MLYSDANYSREKPEHEGLDIGRSPFRRDYGRLLHCPAFRRLQGKTQLFPGHESDFFRNRLTHSLEVAQIAKGIALKLNRTSALFQDAPIDLDLVEFAGLAHDLGHPPFGHNGEKALDDCMKEFGGFEGNAQTSRILARVEKKILTDDPSAGDVCGISPQGKDRRLGLNLCYRTLASILKYDAPIPLRRRKSTALKKGYYSSERPLVENIKRHVGGPEVKQQRFKTIECQIMDIADDIAYSTYDLEDAMKAGFTHPLALLSKFVSKPNMINDLTQKVAREITDVTENEIFDALKDCLDFVATDPFSADGPSDAASLPQTGIPGTLAPIINAYVTSKVMAENGAMRSRFSSALVNSFVNGIDVTARTGAGMQFAKLDMSRDIRVRVESLKHLNYFLMIMSPRLKVVEYRGYDIVRTIFEALNSDEGNLLLPDDVQEMYDRLADTDSKKRVICDFVAGMTDRYAVEFYGRLRETGASIFKPI